MTSKMRGLLSGVAIAGMCVGLAAPAGAQEATSLGTFNAWTAWQSTDANGVMCYISSTPSDSQPGNVNRGAIHFLIIHRKGLGTRNEVQSLIGYPFNTSNANASATIDGRAYPMVTEGEAAWLASASDESGFVQSFRAGSRLVVRGTSQRGTNTTDTYSLSGSAAAMDAIDRACA
ncbi:hypothetical protein EMQ25_14765 [Arsenicitalea aurantiaca]|uniref:Invasion associated locus B family protein n=1 Tax=Arsenicitalea aurantiaca TaxID=1783274 RepID=A0A433X5P5_9HYPH|nr:invasion associated locus B family protein [Arsenicitalea aurantiaca]RUT29379.1 hypothetical protein EMQ25_14765 [Arsenicitalea aurantiaca]